jgi:hypothetical protein
MIQLSEHFTLPEFQKNDEIPAVAIPSFACLCTEILEPVRNYFGALVITSGYRSPAANEEVHGQPNSEHVATADYCAADFYAKSDTSARLLFDYMRGPSGKTLPFHQLILEHGVLGSSVIHVSWNRTKPGVRSVLEGATHNSQPYLKVGYVDYEAASNHDAVSDAATGG